MKEMIEAKCNILVCNNRINVVKPHHKLHPTHRYFTCVSCQREFDKNMAWGDIGQSYKSR